jgi:superfamily I DNA and RNA helicase
MAQTAPPTARTVTLHEMGREFLEATGVKPNFEDTGVFDQMAAAVVQYAPMLKGTFATVVIDEAQDFDAGWIRALVSLATEDTRVVVLEDPAQRLYDRNPWSLPGWVVLNSPVNYRSPRAVVDMINNLALTETPIEWGGAVVGEEPRVYTYEDSLVDAIGTAVADLLAEGFTPDQIVVLTVRGASSSPLFALDINTLIAGQHIKRFTGFGGDGKPHYADGSILIETVYRFKGQAADAVVLIGDLDSLEDEKQRNRMFVGMTRGRLGVSLITTVK